MEAKHDLKVHEALVNGIIDIDIPNQTVWRLINNGHNWTPDSVAKRRQLKLRVMRSGYLKFNLFLDKGYSILLHRAIWIKLHGVPDSKMQINHIDGNKLNNSISNIELVTQQQNRIHASVTGLNPNGLRAVTLPVAKEIQSKYTYRKNGGITKLSKEYGISPAVIHKIVRYKYDNVINL